METDKHYWHQYIQEYERIVFSQLKNPKNILEFGVLRGASILWLSMRFPKAKIVGVDFTPLQPSWPQALTIQYLRVDQGRRDEVQEMFFSLKRKFDLIIDDGSHIPEHQATCLIEGLKSLTSGGFYIIEDVHTSHPPRENKSSIVNAFHLLLAIQNLKNLNSSLTLDVIRRLTAWSLFTEGEVCFAYEKIATIHLYKRTSLPLKCYSCGQSNFDYVTLKCSCGINLYNDFDSMAFMVKSN